MSNGYLVAAEADLEAAHEIGEGFGLDVIDAANIHDHEAFGAALANAPNVGLLISSVAAKDERFVALMRGLALKLTRAQLILLDEDAPAAFSFLSAGWPLMTFEEARSRISKRREAETPVATAPPAAAPEPPPVGASEEAEQTPEPDLADESAPVESERDDVRGEESSGSLQEMDAPYREEPAPLASDDRLSAEPEEQAEAAPPPMAAAPPQAAPAPAPVEPPAQTKRARAIDIDESSFAGGAPASRSVAASAPADATAFAPKKLRRATPELVRIVIHQPKQLKEVIKAARKLDPRTDAAPQSMGIGDVALGENVGVSLDVRGAACDGALQRRTWTGEPIDFSFSVEAEDSAKQAVILARVFVGEAQIGVLAFTRKISGPAKKPASAADVRLTRTKRVFLSYSSADRETVSIIATAYERAGVAHFWDRASLKSGEEWSPRLRKEIDRADLFHLCWSKAAAQSEWVAKEAEHALTRRRRSKGKAPEITVQMLDGPPWAPHPPELDSINFDDFVRAAIVGYARGEG